MMLTPEQIEKDATSDREPEIVRVVKKGRWRILESR